MIRVLLRKEWRETRRGLLLLALVPSLVAIGALLASGFMSAVTGERSIHATGGINAPRAILLSIQMFAFFGIAAAFAFPPFFVAAPRFAGERGEGTLGFLDALPVSRGRVFAAKVLVGLAQTWLLYLLYTALFFLFVAHNSEGSFFNGNFEIIRWAILGETVTTLFLFCVFVLASVLFEATSKAALAGLSLYAAAAVWNDFTLLGVPKDLFLSTSTTIPWVGLAASLAALVVAGWAWSRDFVLRLRWREAAVALFLLPAGLTAWSWFGVLTSDRPLLVDPSGYDPLVVGSSLAASHDRLWIHNRVTETIHRYRTTPDGVSPVGIVPGKFTTNIRLHADAGRLAVLQTFTTTSGRTTHAESTCLSIVDGDRVLTWNLVEKRGRPIVHDDPIALSEGLCVVLFDGVLHIVVTDDTGDSPHVFFDEPNANDVGIDVAGRIVVLRKDEVEMRPDPDASVRNYYPILAPGIWRYERGPAGWGAPRQIHKAEAGEIAMSANAIRDGKIYSVWPSNGISGRTPSFSTRGLVDARLAERGQGVFASSYQGAPIALEVVPIGHLAWDSPTQVSWWTAGRSIGRADASHWVLWPRDAAVQPGINLDVPYVWAVASDGRRIYAASNAGLLWLDAARLSEYTEGLL